MAVGARPQPGHACHAEEALPGAGRGRRGLNVSTGLSGAAALQGGPREGALVRTGLALALPSLPPRGSLQSASPLPTRVVLALPCLLLTCLLGS